MTMYPADPAEAEAATRDGTATEQSRREHYASQPEGDARPAEPTLQPDEQKSAP